MTTVTVRGIQVREKKIVSIDDPVIKEERISLFLNGKFFCGIIATRDHLRELGAGFVVCQGLAGEVDDVSVDGNDIHVCAPVREVPGREIISTGAIGVRLPFGEVRSGLRLSIDDVYRITAEIETDTWRRTGAVHCSVLFSGGEIMTKANDVGRHNTVDKVVGYAVLNGLDRSECVIGCTGRQPRDMVTKAAHAGIPVIISRAASTEQGIETAGAAGITLICFSRKGRFTVYTHPQRIRELSEFTPGGEAFGRETR
ncbi:MAG: formate dehydrogenase accessory sulfurtransferase FdhD [Methanolinea sp.]|nr:formate dehydrogenase accessory sulfurtransferase FdhD [Methanolinea sp.]